MHRLPSGRPIFYPLFVPRSHAFLKHMFINEINEHIICRNTPSTAPLTRCSGRSRGLHAWLGATEAAVVLLMGVGCHMVAAVLKALPSSLCRVQRRSFPCNRRLRIRSTFHPDRTARTKVTVSLSFSYCPQLTAGS